MSVGMQIFSLLDTILYSKLHYSFVVTLEFFKTFHNVSGYLSLCEFTHALEFIVTENRHDSGKKGTSDTSDAAVSHPIVENLIVEEKLRDDQVSSSINLLFQVADVVFTRGRLEMNLWIACDCDAEEVAVLCFDVAHQVNSVVETIFGSNPVCSSSRWVTP